MKYPPFEKWNKRAHGNVNIYSVARKLLLGIKRGGKLFINSYVSLLQKVYNPREFKTT